MLIPNLPRYYQERLSAIVSDTTGAITPGLPPREWYLRRGMPSGYDIQAIGWSTSPSRRQGLRRV